MTRRQFFALTAAGVGAAGLAGANAFVVEPNWAEVTRHDLRAPDDPPRRPVTFAQLTDLHLPKHLGYLEEEVAETVHRLGPDFILLTGDVVDRRNRLDTLADFLRLLPESTPKYATLGNWERWARINLTRLRHAYEQADGRLLINETAIHEQDGTRILLTGLDDAVGGQPDLAAALAGVSPERYHLVLAHSPAYRDQLVHELAGGEIVHRPQLMLSGHTHGGQVDLLGYKPFLPRGTGGYVEGWFTEQRPHLYVSRGVGTSTLPIRFGARPEVALFTV